VQLDVQEGLQEDVQMQMQATYRLHTAYYCILCSRKQQENPVSLTHAWGVDRVLDFFFFFFLRVESCQWLCTPFYEDAQSEVESTRSCTLLFSKLYVVLCTCIDLVGCYAAFACFLHPGIEVNGDKLLIRCQLSVLAAFSN
jgi:hypothetical protein